MRQALSDFILEWNQSHKAFIFSAQEAPGTGRPTDVEIRYSAAKYQSFFSTEKWNKLKDVVEAKSHGTMFVVTDEYLFERGIIGIKVATANHNYQERLIVGVLRWVYGGLFPNAPERLID